MGGGAAFVYGTLMADEVVKLLIKRVPPSRPATLAGYSRFRVKGQVFPAIVPSQSDNKVLGKVWCRYRGAGSGCIAEGPRARIIQAGPHNRLNCNELNDVKRRCCWS